jgi:hypothetical protein
MCLAGTKDSAHGHAGLPIFHRRAVIRRQSIVQIWSEEEMIHCVNEVFIAQNDGRRHHFRAMMQS